MLCKSSLDYFITDIIPSPNKQQYYAMHDLDYMSRYQRKNRYIRTNTKS